MTIINAPNFLGEGIQLLGEISTDIKLEEAKAVAILNVFIQVKYQVNFK